MRKLHPYHCSSKTIGALVLFALFAAALPPVYGQNESAPDLRFEGRLQQQTLGKAYTGALDNLLHVNTIVDKEGKHNPTGLIANPPGTFIRAGLCTCASKGDIRWPALRNEDSSSSEGAHNGFSTEHQEMEVA